MKNSNYLSRLILLAGTLILSGCTYHTQQVWSEKVYSEQIDQFMITNDAQNLVFISSDYHYIFSGQDRLIDVLNWSGRDMLTAEFHETFVVDTEEKIVGQYTIVCDCGNATPAQLTSLENLGFSKNFVETNPIYRLTEKMKGERFVANGLKLDAYSKLNDTYTIRIKEQASREDLERKISDTPLAVATDGIVTLALIPLVAIVLPLSFITQQFE